MHADGAGLGAAIRSGDGEAVDGLLEADAPAMLRVAAALVGETAAEALVVDVLQAVLAHPDSLAADVPLRVALVRAVRARAPASEQVDGDWAAAGAEADLYEPESDRWAGFWRDMPEPWRRTRPGAAVRTAITEAVAAMPPDVRLLLLLRDAESWTSEDVRLLFDMDAATERAVLDAARWSVLRALDPVLGRHRSGVRP